MGHIGEMPFKVAATLAAYRIVGPNATADTVAYPTTITSAMIGVTSDTVLDTADAIAVAGPGQIQKVFFNDTVTSGALVTADTSGRGIPFVGVTASTCWVVGTLIGASIAATGTVADVLVMPQAINVG